MPVSLHSTTCLSLLLAFGVVVAQNPCANQKWRFDPQQCLNFVRQATDDPNLYWFGNSFSQRNCSLTDVQSFSDSAPVTSRNARCFNPRPSASGTFLTLGSRLFSDNDYRSSVYLSKLNSILETQFVSPPELSYSGCNTTAQLPSTTVIDVYPGMPAAPAVLFRKPPRINPVGCNFNRLCTIVFFDASNYALHNVWPNWPAENNFSNYLPPGPPMIHSNPYVLLAFYQTGEIKVDEATLKNASFNVAEFAKTYNLQGPFAINWMHIVTDISAQKSLSDKRIFNTCPVLLEELMKQDAVIINRDLGVSFPLDLKVSLFVEFQNGPLTYSSCCNQFQSSEKNIWVDSLRNGRLAVEHVRNKPSINFESSMLFPNEADFKDQKHSLLLVQPDLSLVNPINGRINDVEVFLHWFVFDISDGRLNSGTETLLYLEPMPTPERPANRFYFLLLKQQGEIQHTKVDTYLNTTCGVDVFSRRCRFPLSRFVRENQMEIVGVARFRLPETAMQQPFVRHLWTKYNITSQEQACVGAPNFPCKAQQILV